MPPGRECIGEAFIGAEKRPQYYGAACGMPCARGGVKLGAGAPKSLIPEDTSPKPAGREVALA